MLLSQLLKQGGLLMVMLVMLKSMSDDCDGHTTCTAITTVYNTTVTCLFAEDISQLSFNVQFFFPNTSVDPEMPLVCNKLTSGHLTCHKGGQVLFDENQKIVDRFTFSRPPSVNELNRGYYQCHAVPSLKDRSQFCPLTYQDVPKFVPLESLHPPPKEENDAVHVFTLVAIVILILFIVMIIVGICLWLKRNSWTVWGRDKSTPGHRIFGAVEGYERSDQRKERSMRIPEGLPAYFYNLGWNEALKDEKNETTPATSSTGKDVPHQAGPSDVPKDPQVITPLMEDSVEETKKNKAKGKGKGKGQDVNTGGREQQGAATNKQGKSGGNRCKVM